MTGPASTAALIDQLRASGVVLTYDPDDRTLRAGGHDALAVTIGKDQLDSRASERRPAQRKRKKRAPAAAGG